MTGVDIVLAILSVGLGFFLPIFMSLKIKKVINILKADKTVELRDGQERLARKAYMKYFWTAIVCAAIAILLMAYNDYRPSEALLLWIIWISVGVGVVATVGLKLYYKKLLPKSAGNENMYKGIGEFWCFSGLEGVFIALTVGFAVYGAALLFIWFL